MTSGKCREGSDDHREDSDDGNKQCSAVHLSIMLRVSCCKQAITLIENWPQGSMSVIAML